MSYDYHRVDRPGHEARPCKSSHVCVCGAVFIVVVCVLKFEQQTIPEAAKRGTTVLEDIVMSRTRIAAHARERSLLEQRARELEAASTVDAPAAAMPAGAAMSAAACTPLPSTLCRASSSPSAPQLMRGWRSPDPLLAHMGVRYLQVGGDWWNRCNEGWLNIDVAFKSEGLADNQIGTDNKGAHNMVLNFGSTTVLPFRSDSVQMIYSEHMLEHMLPTTGGRNWLQELYRVLVPGGYLRIATPDLAKYLCSYTNADPSNDPRKGGTAQFLQQHARRFAPHDGGAYKWPPGRKALAEAYQPSDATVVNNIFRNYGHQWIYDFTELQRLALDAGIPRENICRADLTRIGLPQALVDAVVRATQPKNRSLACWLDQQVRDDESLYVQIVKSAPTEAKTFAGEPPHCQPLTDWMPCTKTIPGWTPTSRQYVPDW